jgi:hypothetical protein
MAARSLGRWRSRSAGAFLAATFGEATALADLDGPSRLRVDSGLARCGAAVRGRHARHANESEHLELLMRTLGTFVRVEAD